MTSQRQKRDIKPRDKFGRWTVLKPVVTKTSRQHRTEFLCRCACGNESVNQASNLISGRSTQCRECGIRAAMKTRRDRRAAQYAGRKVGSTTILKATNRKFHCRCGCGRKFTVTRSNISQLDELPCPECRRQARDTVVKDVCGLTPLECVATLGVTRQRVYQLLHSGELLRRLRESKGTT